MSLNQLQQDSLCYVNPGLEIPPAIQKAVLPNPTLSVLQFIAFPLPIITLGEAVNPVDTFFSHREPSLMNLSIIATVPLPPITTVMALLEASASLESTLPLWVITFWAEVLSLHETQQPWIWAEDALSKWMKWWGKDSGLVERAYNSLSALPWSGKIEGFDDEEPINTLARYATHQWLTNVHEHQMLNILQHELKFDHAANGVEVGNLWMMGFIQLVYKEWDLGTYNQSTYFKPAHHLGQALASRDRKQLKLLKNLELLHRVTFDINFETNSILYRVLHLIQRSNVEPKCGNNTSLVSPRVSVSPKSL